MSMASVSSETMPVELPVKPSLRGVLHHWAAVVALGAGLVLVAFAPTLRAALAAGGFALSLVTLFTVSATYHRVHWSAVGRARMRRLDHASIFVLIAGTYTPVAALGLPAQDGNELLLVVWLGALLGVLQSVFWVSAPKVVSAGLAIALGWTIAPYGKVVWHALPGSVFVLIVAGGLAYTLGGVAYATKRPNPNPSVFGYHEVFHALTLLGAALHYAAVVLLVRAA
jgi:hemolysin III